MTYIVSEDAKITGKWIQLISRSVDIMEVSQSVSVLTQTAVSIGHPVKKYDDDITSSKNREISISSVA